MENDEPLFFSSSSDEEQDEDEPIREEVKEQEAASQPANPRKRPAGGHTPLDLAKCQKVTELSLQNKTKGHRNTVESIQRQRCQYSPPLLVSSPRLLSSGEEPVKLQTESEVESSQP